MYKVCYCTVVDCYCYEDGVPDRFGLPPVEVKVDVSKPFLYNSGVPESLYKNLQRMKASPFKAGMNHA